MKDSFHPSVARECLLERRLWGWHSDLFMILQLLVLLALPANETEAADDFLTPHDPIEIEGRRLQVGERSDRRSGIESDPYVIDGWISGATRLQST